MIWPAAGSGPVANFSWPLREKREGAGDKKEKEEGQRRRGKGEKASKGARHVATRCPSTSSTRMPLQKRRGSPRGWASRHRVAARASKRERRESSGHVSAPRAALPQSAPAQRFLLPARFDEEEGEYDMEPM